MHHPTVAAGSLLVGDETAEALVRDSTIPEPDDRAVIACIAGRLAVFEVRPD